MQERSAFSLTEILIVIITLAIVVTVLLPMKIIDLNQAERIAEWKSFYPELVYSFDLMKQRDKSFVQEYQKDWSLSPYDFFDVFLKYSDVDTEKTENTDFSKYKHIYLNGKIIKRASKYRADKFVVLKNGMILSFTGFDRTSDNVKSSPIGAIFADINGKSVRNLMGRDVFILLLYPDKIEPMGYNDSIQTLKEDCSPVGSGLKCASYYLIGGSF